MIINRVCVIVTCNGCGMKREFDGVELHYDDAADARNTDRDDDFGTWRGEGDIDLCGSCCREAHPFKPSAAIPHLCARCDDLREDDQHSLEERLARNLKPEHPDFDMFYDFGDDEYALVVSAVSDES